MRGCVLSSSAPSRGSVFGWTSVGFYAVCFKFPFEAFIRLQEQVVTTFEQQIPGKLWMGFRLVAVDGTKIRLPLDDELAEAFGTQGNQTETERPMALYAV